MTPKEKAKELVESFHPHVYIGYESEEEGLGNAKQCALIAVSEIIKVSVENSFWDRIGIIASDYKQREYWQQVKTEIEALKKRIKKKEGMEINKIYNENCLETMAKMPDNFIDLTVTSPPYDDLRTYNGYCFDFENVAKELFRVTKQGGILVWIVNDKTDKGSETLSSFIQCLKFKEIGWNVHDTMIYAKNNIPVYDPRNKRYKNGFEFMFVLSKGKPNTYNPIKDVLSKKKSSNGVTKRNPDGSMRAAKDVEFGEYQDRSNVWFFQNGYMQTTKDKIAFEHPAIFPEQLAQDHIISWSNEKDLVYDCFMGSGTVAKMSILNNRNFIGSEISSEYCNIIEKRIKKAWEEKRKEKDLTQKTLFGDGM